MLDAAEAHATYDPSRLRAELPYLPLAREILVPAFILAATPETDVTVSEFSDMHRYVSAESGSRFPGLWRTDLVPYLREPTDCLDPDHPARRVTLKFSAQTGKSEVGVNWFCFIVDRASGPMLTVLPTGDEATKYNRVKIQPTIDASPRIRHRVRPETSRDEAASTTSFKRFAGGFNQIVSASSSKGLQMVSIRWLVLDELSGYLRDVDKRGSPSAQARARQKSWGDLAKELAISTPGMAGECEISDLYDASDKRRYYLPCPHCGDFGVLKYENMLPPSAPTQHRAAFACESCGGIIEQIHREAMLAKGRWIPTWRRDGDDPVPVNIAPENIESYAVPPCQGAFVARQPGWALWSAYSPFEAWTDIWERGAAAKGDPVKEKVFTQQDLGEPYEPSSDAPDWEKLLSVRSEFKRGVVPWPASTLTGFIDVQGNRFEWGLWAWGEGFQGWLVDRDIINHDYNDPAAWAELDALTSRTWPTSGGQEIDVLQWGIDTGAFTQALYDKVAGRGALLATKGDNRPQAVPLKKGRADLKDARGRNIAGRRIDLAMIGNFDLKMSVYEGLRSLVAGPDESGAWRQGTLHLPHWIGEEELRQLTAETLIDPREYTTNTKSKLVKPGDKREWRKKPHQPNESLDIAVGCKALAWGEGAGRLSAARWAELAAEAHKPVEKPADLFTAPPLAAPIAPAAPSPVAPPPKEDIDALLERLSKANAERWT